MATSIGSNPHGAGTLYGTTGMPKQTDPQSGAAGATAGAGAPVLQTLSDDQLRELAADLAAANAGLTAALGDYGSTPISLPEVTVTTDMGALSTADLLQLIRAESRKTTELLLIATSESIKNQQAQIDLDSQSSIAQLKDAAASQEKAEKMAKTMNIVKWVAFGVGVAALAAMAVAAVVTGGAALIAMVAISALLMATMTVLSEVKCADGRSPMDHGMEWLTDVMAKLGEAMDKLPPWLLPLVPGGALFAIPDSVISDELKAQIMAQLLMITVMIVISVVAVGAAGSMVASAAQTSATVASEAATTAATMASETSAQAAANAAARVASEMGIAATKVSKYLELLQGGLNLANSGVGIAEAKFEFDASMANARVQELKEMVKMLQTLLDGDAEFISMLAEIQAQLDSGCAEIVATEHQTQENIGREMFS